MTVAAYDAVKHIRNYQPNFTATVGLVLGSGMSKLVECIQDPVIIPYQELPGFHHTSIAGHPGNLYIGTFAGIPVACLQGRAHLYEQASYSIIKTMVRTLKLLGCRYYIATNASGAIREDVQPGDLMLIQDHINWQFHQVLTGPNEDDFGPRFPSMHDAYDPELRALFMHIAEHSNIHLTEGTYMGTLGPNFETPAEIKAFRILGADCVGMSTIPEVTIARHCGMRVAVISSIANMAAGIAQYDLSHEETLQTVSTHMQSLATLLPRFIQACATLNTQL